MSFSASAALDYESYVYPNELPSRKKRMTVVTGGGLDAQARKGISTGFVHTLQIVLLAVFVFFALGAVRVAITAQTVILLRDNASMQTQIEEMADANDSLRVERSVLSSSARIVAIATDNYGMHLASASESLVLPDELVAADEVVDESTGTPARVVAANMD